MKKATVPSILVTVVLLALAVIAEAQQPLKIPLIGRLSPGSPSANTARTEAFRQGLRELGYVEGKNIVIERRSAEGRLDRLPALAADLVRLKVDIIVTAGPAATRAAKEATSTIPIVMTNDSDPVSTGFIASLSHPGGNITGLSTFAPELSGKQLELLKEVVPTLSSVAVLGTSTSPSTVLVLKELELATRALKVKFRFLDVQNPEDIESTFRAIKKERAEAVLLLATGPLASQRTQVVDLAVKNQLPAVYPSLDFVQAGGLMSYGTNYPDLDRRVAYFVDRILKGAKPADLPVEQPMKFELVINLKTAKQIGLTIPPNVLARADKVIK
jgi:putative tryptophan/tyrosine transport system substrate-binding protein